MHPPPIASLDAYDLAAILKVRRSKRQPHTLPAPVYLAALATVVGVLIEVPIMLFVVGVVNRSRRWYESHRDAVNGPFDELR